MFFYSSRPQTSAHGRLGTNTTHLTNGTAGHADTRRHMASTIAPGIGARVRGGRSRTFGRVTYYKLMAHGGSCSSFRFGGARAGTVLGLRGKATLRTSYNSFCFTFYLIINTLSSDCFRGRYQYGMDYVSASCKIFLFHWPDRILFLTQPACVQLKVLKRYGTAKRLQNVRSTLP